MNRSATRNLLNRDELLQLTYKTAGSGQRLANYVVDALCYFFTFFTGCFILATATDSDDLFVSAGGDYFTVLYYLGWLIYYVLFERLMGQTPGKLVTGTRVISSHGGPPSTGQVLGRSFARLLPFEALSFLGSSQPRGWHDRLSNTRVVREAPLPTAPPVANAYDEQDL